MKTKFGYLVFAILLLVCIIFFSLLTLTVKLTCIRVAKNQPVNCVKHSTLLWFISAGDEEIDDIRGATLGITETDDTYAHRIEVLTSLGSVPLEIYTGGFGAFSPRNDAVNQINAFVQNSAAINQIVVTDPGVISSEAVPVLFVMLAFSLVVNYRNEIDYWLSRLSFTKTRK
jgi:hypothetical protein